MTEKPTRIGFWKLAYQEHAPAVLRFLSRRLDSREDAEDLLHETFVRVINAGGQLREPERVRSYLFTTANNLLRNHRRRRAGAHLVPLEDHHESGEGGAESADSAVFMRALVERLAGLVEGMTAAQRTAFQLGLVERLPYQEIAVRTGWSLAQVKINIYRTRKRTIAGLGDVLPGAVRRHFDGKL